ncbi:MAG: hypothetical protein JNK11_00175 [Alphaproteobacteria bacterium]|nr:hypothetical protein [Alphaproteobacteria bacterium]
MISRRGALAAIASGTVAAAGRGASAFEVTAPPPSVAAHYAAGCTTQLTVHKDYVAAVERALAQQGLAASAISDRLADARCPTCGCRLVIAAAPEGAPAR